MIERKTIFLPYYKIEQTEEGRQFFLGHEGYFNFWDDYLVMNIKEGLSKVFFVLVNRTGRKFSNIEPTEDCRVVRDLHITRSVKWQKPKEMFIDFPELEKFDFLIKGTFDEDINI